MQKYCMRVWGHTLAVAAESPEVLEPIHAEFAGSVVDAPDGVPAYEFTAISGALTVPNGLLSRVRHRGGSSGDKKFMDGSVFRAQTQNRDALVVREDEETGSYILDECMVHSHERYTLAVGRVQGRFLLPDLIEAYLLNWCRQMGWIQCHGAGWVEDGSAHLAVGPSGAGKTTNLLARLRQGGKFLGNDRIFLRMRGDVLEARGYPLAMNIGCGTIRGLGLDIPHHGGHDHDKIRLSPSDVAARMPYDYDTWWPVATISARGLTDLVENLYVEPDPCHPAWNAAWRSPFPPETAREILAAASAPGIFQEEELRLVSR